MRAQFIYEKFTQDTDPIHDMGIGLRSKIKKWLKEHNVRNYILNKNLTINVNDPVDLSYQLSENLPKYINFEKAMQGFSISNNKNVTSLRGCPKYIGRDFNCMNTSIENLKYSPRVIKNDFMCSFMYELKSLEGISKHIYHNFYCRSHHHHIKFSLSDIPNYCKIEGLTLLD